MFSDIFYKADKYNLNTFEYVSTYERMPWNYTGLVDSSYLPNFNSEITAKLNRFFQYRFPNMLGPLHDDNKVLSIEYVGSEITSYFLINPIKYYQFSSDTLWKHFSNFCGFDHFCECKTKLDRLTDETDIVETDIIGIHYDKDANYSGVRIFDPTYNLSEYSQNEKLSKINQFCKKYRRDCKGEIDVFHESNNLRYTFKPFLPRVILQRNRANNVWEETCDNPLRRSIFLDRLVVENFISEEQKQFIVDTCVNNSMFSIDFIVSEQGELVDMFLRHIKVVEFEDLTTA